MELQSSLIEDASKAQEAPNLLEGLKEQSLVSDDPVAFVQRVEADSNAPDTHDGASDARLSVATGSPISCDGDTVPPDTPPESVTAIAESNEIERTMPMEIIAPSPPPEFHDDSMNVTDNIGIVTGNMDTPDPDNVMISTATPSSLQSEPVPMPEDDGVVSKSQNLNDNNNSSRVSSSVTNENSESHHPGVAAVSNGTQTIAAANSSCGALRYSESDSDDMYHIKWIRFDGRKTATITQNKNGPCPLLAIVNCLLLKQKITLHEELQRITTAQLLEHVTEYIFTTDRPKEDEADTNYEQNVHDAMESMNNLQTGLDVNVKFSGVFDFEFTREVTIFDLVRVTLCHGWLPEADHDDTSSSRRGPACTSSDSRAAAVSMTGSSRLPAISSLSYNQLAQFVAEARSSPADASPEVAVAHYMHFLESSASQLTYRGIHELEQRLQHEAIVVLFRNNHFLTLHKRGSDLLQLITDQGFLMADNIVWETLSSVQGETRFLDGKFAPATPLSDHMVITPLRREDRIPDADRDAQERRDMELAMALSGQHDVSAPPPSSQSASSSSSTLPAAVAATQTTGVSPSTAHTSPPPSRAAAPFTSLDVPYGLEADADLARRLQEEDDRLYAEQLSNNTNANATERGGEGGGDWPSSSTRRTSSSKSSSSTRGSHSSAASSRGGGGSLLGGGGQSAQQQTAGSFQSVNQSAPGAQLQRSNSCRIL